MKNKNGKTVVPTAAMRPLIQEWAERSALKYGRPASDQGNCGEGLYTVLSRESGVSIRRISGIMNDWDQEYVLFDTADKLLCAMQMQHEWQTTLAEYYGPLEVAHYERHLVHNVDTAMAA